MELPILVWNRIAILGFCLIFTRAGQVLAYPTPIDFNGKTTGWEITPDTANLYFKVFADNEEDLDSLYPIVEEAADLWNAVEDSMIKIEEGTADQNTQIAVNLKREIRNSAYASAYTEIDSYTSTDHYGHCSIYVRVTSALRRLSVAKAILHEFGHCLGLGHSLIPEAIMSYQLSKNTFALDIDDEAALSRLYPLNGKSKLPRGCAGIAVLKQSKKPQKLMLLWLVLLIPAFFTLLLNARAKVSARAKEPSQALRWPAIVPTIPLG